jgi:polyphenol oxidase
MHVLTARNLSDAPAIAHGFFGRQGGVSEGIYASLNCGPGSGDDNARVIENRRRALAALAPDGTAKLVTLHQVHSAHAVTVKEPWEIGAAPQADAMATNVPGIALGILTADCAPVLLVDNEARVVGAAHAGWKGAEAGVIAAAVAAMEALGARRKRIRAGIGPSISQRNYEVGPEFRARFIALDAGHDQYFMAGKRPDHWQFDLEAFVGDQIEAAGISDIQCLSTCTYAHEDSFFSFRRTTHRGEADYGRDISAIMLKP